MTRDAATIIVGAGLSGLALARALIAERRDVVLLEARDRAGGRMLSQGGYDLGPAWVWPQNRRMLDLIRDLGLRTYPQHDEGRLVFEDAGGSVRRDLDFSTMKGALRIAGGMARITDRLADGLGTALRLRHPVTQVLEEKDGVVIVGAGFLLRAQEAVLALPPRLAARLGISIPDVPTWMAGQTKLVAVYDIPFWRTAGLNGDAISQIGPLAEIHDAAQADSRQGALFGFARSGAARRPSFREEAVAQLARLFGPEAASPRHILVKDWSADPATATPDDLVQPASHPSYRPLRPSRRIFLAGSETAATNGGFLEGALEAAEATHRHLARLMV